MKRIFAIALLTLSTIGTSTAMLAQDQGVHVTIPFGFAVGDKVLPADTYTVTSSMRGIVQIQSIDKRFAAITVAFSAHRSLAEKGKLVFTKYGDSYFLHQILCPAAANLNVELATSKREKRIQASERSPNRGEVAMLEMR